MTRRCSDDKTRQAAEIDEAVLRSLEQAMPIPWRKVVALSAVGSSIEIREDNLEDLLLQVSEEERIGTIGFSIY